MTTTEAIARIIGSWPTHADDRGPDNLVIADCMATNEADALLTELAERIISRHAGEPAPTDLDTRIKEAAIALAVATVASCDCDTKTPDPEFHKAECTYASLRMAMARVDRIIGRRAGTADTSERPGKVPGMDQSGASS